MKHASMHGGGSSHKKSKNGTTDYGSEPRRKAGSSVGAGNKKKGVRTGNPSNSSKRPTIGTGK